MDILVTILKFLIGSGVIGTMFWLALGGIKHGIVELSKDVDNLLAFLDGVYDKTHDYWISPPSSDDHIKELAITRDLHYIAQEVSRINEQYAIYSKEKLRQLNQSLNETITLHMSSRRTVNMGIVKNAGRIINHYKVYLRHGLVKRNSFIRRVVMAAPQKLKGAD